MGDSIRRNSTNSNNSNSRNNSTSRRAASRCQPSRTPLAAENAALNNHSIRRAEVGSRQRAHRTAPFERKEKIHPGSLKSFLQDYPSLEDLYREFPELTAMELPNCIDDDGAKSFAVALKRVLDHKRYDRLMQNRQPRDILPGMNALRARSESKEAGPPRKRIKLEAAEPDEGPTAESKEAGPPRKRVKLETDEPKEKPTRSRSRPTLPGNRNRIDQFLLGREIGSRSRPGQSDLADRLRSVHYDQSASMAILANFKLDSLNHYRKQIESLINSAVQKGSCAISYLYLKKCTTERTRIPLVDNTDIYVRDKLNLFLIPLRIEEKILDYFIELSCLECNVRFLEELRDDSPLRKSFAYLKDPYDGMLVFFAKKVLREFIPSMLRVIAQSSPVFRGNPGSADYQRKERFQRALITSLVTLYENEKADFSRAREVFESTAKIYLPDIPGYDGKETETDTEAVKTAKKRIRKDLSYDYEEEAELDEVCREYDNPNYKCMKNFIEVICFYYLLSADRGKVTAYHLASMLDLVFDHTGLKPPVAADK